MRFSRQEYWSGLPFPSPGHLPYPGIEPWFSTLQADSLPSEPIGEARKWVNQFSSVAHSCPTLCDPMNHSTPGLPVHHQLWSLPKPMSIESVMHPGLISFRMNWLDLLAVQGTLKSLLQYHSSKASILPCSALFVVQFSHPYMTTGKNIALIRWTFVDKVIPLLFNMLSRLLLTFLPRSKHLLI